MTKNVVVFDLETDGLYRETNNIWCIGLKVNNDKPLCFTSSKVAGSDGTLSKALEILQQADVLVGHNIINFDLPVLKKLCNFTPSNEILDTVLISKLLYPNIIVQDIMNMKIPKNLKGRHSLKSWGYRLGNYKDVYEDWSKLTPEMVSYCKQDVALTYDIYNNFKQKGLPPAKAIDIEQKFATVISRQEKYGWYFDIERAQQLHVELLEEKEPIYQQLIELFQPLKDWVPVKPVAQFTKKGDVSKLYEKQIAKGCQFNEDLEWGYYKTVDFNPKSGQHIYRFVEHYIGKQKWSYTEAGTPKTGADVLLELLADNPIAKPLIDYLNICSVISKLAESDGSWLNLVDRKTHRIYGSVDTLGAVTRRCTHNKPNIAQVPSGKKYKGHECRELFRVPKGKKLVGCDADGLELRTLSHYMAKYDNGAYALAVDSGDKDKGTDIHTVNQKATGLPTRDDAKTFILT